MGDEEEQDPRIALIQLRETLTPESFNFMCECELGKEKAKDFLDKIASDDPPDEDECKDIMHKIAIWGQFMYSVSLITQLNSKLGEPEVEKYIAQVMPIEEATELEQHLIDTNALIAGEPSRNSQQVLLPRLQRAEVTHQGQQDA